MRKLGKVICAVAACVMALSSFPFAACAGGEGGDDGNADSTIRFTKPSVPVGVVLEEVTDFNAILQAIFAIKTGIYASVYDWDKSVTQTDYAVYGKVTINKIFNAYDNLDIDGVRYTRVDGVKTDGREFYGEIKYISDGDGRAAKFDLDFIKTQIYSDNVSATQDYADVETQKYLITDKDGMVNSYFNGELEDSSPEEELKFYHHDSFEFSDFYGVFSGLYYLKNVTENGWRDIFYSDVIAYAEACVFYNEGQKRLPVYWDNIGEYYSFYDFDNEGYYSWEYEKEEVTKHSLTVRTNSKQYWLDLEIEVMFSNMYGSLTKIKTYQYTVYLDTEPSVTVQDIEAEIE